MASGSNQFVQARKADLAKAIQIPLLREAVGILLLAVAAFLGLCLISFNRQDPSLNHAITGPVRNLAGLVGAHLADVLYQALGFAALFLPLILLISGVRLMRRKPLEFYWDRILATPMFILVCALGAAFFVPPALSQWLPAGPGGVVGRLAVPPLEQSFGHWGSTILLSAAGLLSLMVLTRFSLVMTLDRFISFFSFGHLRLERAGEAFAGLLQRIKERQKRHEEWLRKNAPHPEAPVVEVAPAPTPAPVADELEVKPVVRERVLDEARFFDDDEEGDEEGDDFHPRRLPARKPSRREEVESLADDDADMGDEDEELEAFSPPVKKRPAPVRERGDAPVGARGDDLEGPTPLPPLSLLARAEPGSVTGPSKESLAARARQLEAKLAEFAVRGSIIEIHPGPVVTTFELDPAPGLKSSKVIGLSEDLARSIAVTSVRVVGNVPGKSVIGIEIPSEQRQTVFFRQVLESDLMQRNGSSLAVALGSDISGNPVVGDLGKMPHLLIAGTTGSGKSVAVNAMICSLLFRTRPEEVRLLMVDPKMLEFSMYEGIPHLLSPVVTDVRKAANLLKWAVSEMEDRYRTMSEMGVRNIAGYNQKIIECRESGEQLTQRVTSGFEPDTGRPIEREEPIPLETKPFIVIFIDELADMMMQVGKEVEPAIARLAQKARAAGIHLVVATQRPSVDVITGLIKANFPTRLAFKVSTRIDSRTTLDTQGAESLLGMGDGLFLPPGTSRLQRIHAPFVSDDEVSKLVKFLKSTGRPQYDEKLLRFQEEGGGGEDGEVGGDGDEGGESDELYDQSVAMVLKARKVSTSMVQRHFKIGYNRAARIVERMEREGLVSEANSSGKREVLVPKREE